MKRAAAPLILALAAVAASGQVVDNMVSVKQFPGTTVGFKLTAAMATCGTNTLIPCYLVLDPSLAVYPPGTFPTLCSHCFLLDWRSGPPGGGGGVGTGAAPQLALYTAGNTLGASPYLSGSTSSTFFPCLDPTNLDSSNTSAICGEYPESESDSQSVATFRDGFHFNFQSLTGGVYNYIISSGTKSQRSGMGVGASFNTVAQNSIFQAFENCFAGGECMGLNFLQNNPSGYIGKGEETAEGIRIQQSQQDPVISDGAGGIWAATASNVNSGTGVVTFGTPSSGPNTLGESRFIRDLGSKETVTYTAVSCSGSPYTCMITGTGFSTLAGYASNPHTTWISATPGNPILTNNVVFCPAPGANDSMDLCVPVTAISSDTSLTVNLQAVGTQGTSTGWSWPVSGSAALYHSAYPTAISIANRTFTAGDVSGITNGHNLDQVMAYNGDTTGIYIYQVRTIGRVYGGGVNFENQSDGGAPGFAYGLNFAGNYGHLLISNTNGSGSPVSIAETNWDPTLGFGFFDDYAVSSADDCLFADSFSNGLHLCAIGIDKNAASTDSWQFANGGLDVDQNGNGTFAGALSSLNGGFGPYSNFAVDSEFQAGTTYWANAGITGSAAANGSTDPWGLSTAEVFTAPTLTTGQFSGQNQTTTTTSAINGVYACSIWASSSSGAYFVIGLFGPTWSPVTPTGGALNLTSTMTKYTVTGMATSAAAIQFKWVTYTSGAVINVSQAQCQTGSTTGTQVITGTSPVSGNGLVINGNPFTVTTVGSSGAATFSGGKLNIPQYSGGGMTWPALAGIPNYNGSGAWGTSYSASNPIPANFISTLNQSTTGTAGNLSGTPALPNGVTATTQTAGDNSTKLATTAYVATAIGTVVADTTITVGTTAIGANACSSVATATMTGVSTAMTFTFTPSSDFHSTVGWSAAGATLYFFAWATSNTLNYYVCNNSSASITPGASTTWNVSAR